MSATGNGTTQYMDTFPGTITPLTSAYSWGFWYKPGAAAAMATPHKQPFTIINTAGGTPTLYQCGFLWQHSSTDFWKAAMHRQADGTFKTAQIPYTPAYGAWVYVAATYDGTTLRLYYGGVLANSVAATAPSASAGDPNISVCAWNNGADDFDDSPIAEASVWSVCLTAEEVLSLAQSTPVSSVQYGSVVWYDKLNTGVATVVGPALTNSGCTLNTTYFCPTPGGVSMGGNLVTSATKYHWNTSGGIKMGGSLVASQAKYHHTMAGGISMGGDQVSSRAHYHADPTGGIAMGGNLTTSGAHFAFTTTGGIAMGGNRTRIIQPVDSGAVIVATGREPAFSTK
jgi:hypothetical protein